MIAVDWVVVAAIGVIMGGIVYFLWRKVHEPLKWPNTTVPTPPGAVQAMNIVAGVYGLRTRPNLICLAETCLDEKARPAHRTNKGTPVQASLVPYAPQVNVTAGFPGFTWATSGLAFAMWEYFEAFGAGQLGLPDTYSKSPARQDGTMQRKVAEAEAALTKAGL